MANGDNQKKWAQQVNKDKNQERLQQSTQPTKNPTSPQEKTNGESNNQRQVDESSQQAQIAKQKQLQKQQSAQSAQNLSQQLEEIKQRIKKLSAEAQIGALVLLGAGFIPAGKDILDIISIIPDIASGTSSIIVEIIIDGGFITIGNTVLKKASEDFYEKVKWKIRIISVFGGIIGLIPFVEFLPDQTIKIIAVYWEKEKIKSQLRSLMDQAKKLSKKISNLNRQS